MGAKYSKHHKDSDEVSEGGGPMAKAKALLLFSELYSEGSSESISTPSCTSVEDVMDRRLNWNKEIPALHNLEEGMMQAKQTEDMKQAKMQRKARGPSAWSGVEASDQILVGPTEGRQQEEDEPSFQGCQQPASTGKRSTTQSSTGSNATSAGASSFVSFGEKDGTKSKNTPGIQLK